MFYNARESLSTFFQAGHGPATKKSAFLTMLVSWQQSSAATSGFRMAHIGRTKEVCIVSFMQLISPPIIMHTSFWKGRCDLSATATLPSCRSCWNARCLATREIFCRRRMGQSNCPYQWSMGHAFFRRHSARESGDGLPVMDDFV